MADERELPSEDVLAHGHDLTARGVSATEQLRDEPDDVLCRLVEHSRDDVNESVEMSTFGAAVFLLRDRGYETDIGPSGHIRVWAPDGSIVVGESE